MLYLVVKVTFFDYDSMNLFKIRALGNKGNAMPIQFRVSHAQAANHVAILNCSGVMGFIKYHVITTIVYQVQTREWGTCF
jgi:hypothetical protein